jgi:ribonuclease P protein component
MLPKKNRANRRDLQKVFKNCLYIHSPSLTFKYIQRYAQATPVVDCRISFVVPKSVSKKAVERNFLRRRGYDALARNLDMVPYPLVGVFVFKSPTIDLDNEIKAVFSKIR